MAAKKKSNPQKRILIKKNGKSKRTSSASDRNRVVFFYVPFPDLQTAKNHAHALISEKFIVCANLIPQMDSIYLWKGSVQSSSECLAILKCAWGRRQKLEKKLQELHPYEVPCIAQIALLDLNESYRKWINQS